MFCAFVQGLEHWKKFYAESKKYNKVGRVSHPPIDPASPIPVHCDAKKAQASIESERSGPMPTDTTSSREEL